MSTDVITKNYSRISASDVEIGEILCQRKGSELEPIEIGKVLWIEPDMLDTERTFFVPGPNGKETVGHPFANDAQVWVAD